MRNIAIICGLLLSFSVNAQLPAFNAADQPAAPDYSKPDNWAALPFRTDAADIIPKSETWVNDSLKEVDVFYIHPTTYRGTKVWCADVSDAKGNKVVDDKPVRYQASAFNASARVYAPRYRQAAIEAFHTDKPDGNMALLFAYEDVKRAFEYYLKYYNNGRPFIIASHSQGTWHARKLLADMVDKSNIRNRMVAAYVIGYGIDTAAYTNLRPMENENQTGGYITWASFKKGYDATGSKLYGNVCINPINWTRSTAAVSCSESKGGMLLNFNKRYKNACATQIHNNYLWVKTKIPFAQTFKVMHIVDYNLFWYDIRANVPQRISTF